MWPAMITNGAQTTNPQTGALMVLDAWDTNPAGDVTWVWGRSGYWTCVLHTNMKVGTDYFISSSLSRPRSKDQKTTKSPAFLAGQDTRSESEQFAPKPAVGVGDSPRTQVET